MNRKSRILRKVLCFTLVALLVFMIYPNTNVYAADVGVGTDGKTVNLSLWKYSVSGDGYCLDKYTGSIVDGKIVGCVPAMINGKPVVEMSNTFVMGARFYGIEDCEDEELEFPDFEGCEGLIIAPEIPESVIKMTYTFSGCEDLIQAPKIPSSVTEMNATFCGCISLTQAPKIPNGVTRLSHTFTNCKGLTQAPEIPNSVTDIFAAFSRCSGLTQVSEIPNSVTDLSYAFYECTALTQAPKITGRVTAMTRTFYGCKNLTQAPEIPNGVTSLLHTFSRCTSLTKAPEIPDSVTDLDGTFSYCTSLIQSPVIPNSVINMTYTFCDCTALTQAPIIPSSVIDMTNTFSGCTALTKALKIPSSVMNMSYTFRDCTSLVEAPEISDSITNKFKVYMILCPEVSNREKTMFGTFYGCTALTKPPKIPNNITNIKKSYSYCTSLTKAPEIPNSVTNISETFNGCTSLTQAPDIPNSVTDMLSTFEGCANLTGNVSIPQNVTALTDIFKDTASPITMIYSSKNTVAASYEAPSNVTKAVDKVSPEILSITCDETSNVIINATDDFGVDKYAVSTSDVAPTSDWQSSNSFSNLADGKYYAWAMDRVGNISACKEFILPQAIGIDGKSVDFNLWNFTCNGDTYSLDKYIGSIVDGKIIGSVPAVINGKPVTSMANTFKDCKELMQAPEIPNSVINIESAFSGCTSLTQAPEIPNSVSNMESTFSGCTRLTQAPVIPSGVTNMRYTFNGCTALVNPPVLPSSVTTINHAFSNCKSLTQAPEIPNGVTDMYGAFSRCTNLTQMPKIPDSVRDLSYAFNMCTGLTQFSEIPNGVTDIKYTFSGCTSITGDIFIPNSVKRMLNIFINTAMPITMIYSSNNKTAVPHEAPVNVTKIVDSDVPVISTVTGSTETITINATDNYSVAKYALTKSSTAPTTDLTTGWQSSNKFENLADGRYYAWAMDRVGNISNYKAFVFPQVDAVGTDGNGVDLLLWNITNNGDTYSLDKYVGDIVDGKIIGTVPAKIDGKPVTVMANTFKDCKGLNQAPEIPDSVTDLNHTFAGCTALTQAPEIPSGVVDMNTTFSRCYNLVQPPKIPDSVKDMYSTFYMCTGLNQMPGIPNGVTDMKYTFYRCYNVTGEIFIPNSVIKMYDCFAETLKPITMIYSSNNKIASSHTAPSNVQKVVDLVLPEISSITTTGGAITIDATDNYSGVKYALTTSDAVPTAITTSWQSSNTFSNLADGRYYGWAMDKVGNISDCKVIIYPQVDAIDTDGNAVDLLLWDFTNNGDTYSVDKYLGDIVDGKIIGSVPATIGGKPVTVMANAFKGCKGLTQAPEIPNSVTNMESTFYGCTGLTQAPAIPDGVTNMRYTFCGCTALEQSPVLPSSVTTINHAFTGCTALTHAPQVPNGVTDMYGAFSRCTNLTQTPQIPNSVKDMSYAFNMCTGLTQLPVIPDGVTDMKYTFSGCTSITGELYIPNSVKRMLNIFENTLMPITMIYSKENAIASSYVSPSNVTKVVDALDFPNIGLTISSGVLSPSFEPETLNYTAPKVPYGTTSVTVSAIAVDPASTITVNGVAMIDGQSTVNMNVGINTINILVTTVDGSTKNYSITVEREHGSVLSDLTISSGTLYPAFSSSNLKYTTQNVLYDTTSVTVTPTTTIPDCTITVNGNVATSGQPSTVNLNVGINTINIVVTNGAASKTYTIAVVRASSPYLTQLEVTYKSGKSSYETKTVTINTNQTEYNIDIPNTLTSVTVKPIAQDVNAVILVNGQNVLSGISASIAVVVGTTRIPISVTSAIGTDSKAYGITTK